MVREHIDTIDALMARYVAGSLPAPARVLVKSHLEMRPEARGFVKDLESLAGEALEAVEPEPIGDRDGALQGIFSSNDIVLPMAPEKSAEDAADLPAALRDFIGYGIDDIPWRTKMPGFKEYNIGDVDGCTVSMFWIRPGRAIPAHTHHGCEITLVLRGAFSDGVGRYGPGDISVADDDVDHRPVAENAGPCIGFAVTDAPLRMTGSFRQLIGDLIG
ncbi:ChrR family anti-sigma-E factor [Pararhizobium haloflavum]|uniref:ChrR family anti-sigma-E factor n=1 Tax=Pararhizobium haloflavum TaxID=2037914 RepID=UPI000C18FD74|nr:ChrR family anti-sigma-E factor [Pararhizobium haloflavum]